MNVKSSKFLEAGTWLFFLNISASALNYLCQLVMARVLSVGSYGTINTIFSFMMIVAVPGTTLTMIVARYYASNDASNNERGYLKKQLLVVSTLTIIAFVILFALNGVMKNLLAIDDRFVLIIAFILAALGYFQPLYSGVFSGKKCFILVGIYSLMIPVYKLIAVGGAFLYSENDKSRLHVLLVIMVVGVLGTALIGQIKTDSLVGKISKNDVYNKNLYTIDDFNTLILNMSLMLYMNIDLLAVRYYGDEKESGLYSAVLLFGRIIYYFATTLGTVLLPSVAEKSLTENERKSTLNKALLLMVLFAILCMIPLNLWRSFFIQLLYGQDYLLASKYMIFVSIISFALSVYTIMVNYVVGIGRTKAVTVIMVVVDILLLSVLVFMKNIISILTAIGIIGVVGTVIIYSLSMKKRNYGKTR